MGREINQRKAAIIGCGFVGSATAFTLMQSQLFSELVLVDVDFDKVTKMDIGKGKFWIYTEGSDEPQGIPIKATHGYEQAGCNICNDYVCEFADISTGSVGAPDGWSTVLTRTDAGVDIFSAAVDAGLIETKPMDDVKPGLGLLEKLAKGKKDKGKKEIERRAKMGVMTPTYY